MSPFTTNFFVVCAATLTCAIVGWVAPPSRGRVQIAEIAVLAGGFALGWLMSKNPLTALPLGSLFPGVYYTFGWWQRPEGSSQKAFWVAFFGVTFFLFLTSHRYDYVAMASTLAFVGPRAAVWITARTHRAVGLGLLVAATCFQLTRVPILFVADPSAPHFTTTR